MNEPQAGSAVVSSVLLGSACLILLLILSSKPAFNHQDSFLQAGKLSLYLRVKFLSLLLFVKFRYRRLPLHCEYAFLQFLRCKYWLIHGIDVMDLPLPNDQARPGSKAVELESESRKPGSLERDH